jgi:formylglycine-generating enzyme required for sulfatase activity
MHGNVWEWTADEHCPYPSDTVVDPRAQCGAALHVIRGGSWYFGADSARCALRYTHAPKDKGFSLGFRVVREPSAGR